jgi:DNA (cytosine-5)-methyltransferase 1
MKLGSLFDGIGGWLIAATRAGITPIWSSEVAAFPQAVTAKHFPDVKQLGDITKIDGAAVEPVDIVTMGSPCQDNTEEIVIPKSGLYSGKKIDITSLS